MYSTCAYDCFETLVPLSGQTSNSSNTLHTKHFNQLLSVCVVHHWAANRQCKAWLWSLSPWFHWARLCLTACATLFCSSFHATSYPTGSVSETERHSRLMLLSCSDFVYFVISRFLCPHCGCVGCVVTVLTSGSIRSVQIDDTSELDPVTGIKVNDVDYLWNRSQSSWWWSCLCM